MSEERSLSKYWVMKLSWKGKYPRVFCVNSSSVETLDCDKSFKSTNKWNLGGTFLEANPKAGSITEFTILVKKSPTSSSTETLTFASEHRAYILSDIQEQKWISTGKQMTEVITARKYTSTEDWIRVEIVVTNFGLLVLDTDTRSIKSVYYFTQIMGIGKIQDVPSAFVLHIGSYGRLHMYASDRVEEILRRLQDAPARYLGLPPPKSMDSMLVSQFDTRRLGVVLAEMSSLLEYSVMKPPNMTRRTLCVTETCMVERDVRTYNAVTVRHLIDLLCVVRCEEDAQRIFIQYRSNPKKVTCYITSDRDSLLATLLDSARHVGNTDVVLRVGTADLGKRVGPCGKRYVDVEMGVMKMLAESATGGNVLSCVKSFNENVPYCPGELIGGAPDKIIYSVATVVLEGIDHKGNPSIALDQFHALHRICSTRGGFSCPTIIQGFVTKIGALVVRGLKMHHVGVTHAAIEFLSTLLCPQHDNYDYVQEINNKSKILVSETFVSHITNMLNDHALKGTGAVVVKSIIEMLSYAVCYPFSETTDEGHFSRILKMLAEKSAVALFRLLRHPCKSISRNAGRVLQVVLEEGTEESVSQMQAYALTECAILLHFQQGAFCAHEHNREQRDLARHLIGLYCKENTAAQDLLKRMVPNALLFFLQELTTSGQLPEAEKFTSHAEMRVTPAMQSKSAHAGEPPKLRSRVINLTTNLNWPWFFYKLSLDHTRPDLIWNHQTRHELKEAIDLELNAFLQGCQTVSKTSKSTANDAVTIAWNHYEFEVMYPSLHKELRIGGQFFLRLLLEATSSTPPEIAAPKDFFNDLYHHFLLLPENTSSFAMKLQSLQGMTMLYQFFSVPLGVFNDLGAMLSLLESTTHIRMRDQIVLFLQQLLKVKQNAKILMDGLLNPSPGLNSSVLIDILATVHLYSDQSVLHNTHFALEGPKEVSNDQSPEWYYVDEEGASVGPITYKDLCEVNKDGTLKVWAQGLSGWVEVHKIQQLKIFDSTHGLLSPRDLACSLLDLLLQLCEFYPNRSHDGRNIVQPLPRVKRYLSQGSILPHLVQLLLTFDSSVVNRTATLLFQVLQDSPAIPRVHQTGIFFFLLMYLGSDIKPMCKLLHLIHDQQAWGGSGSILSPLLPTALICFLRNYGPEKFAEVFLGEYDTPEVIWNTAMRKYLINKLSVHVMEFSPRLRSNTKAIYQYCPMVPPVEYDELTTELFVHSYYLRHLCDEIKFPNWHIANPVGLLRDVLEEWNAQLELQANAGAVTEDEWNTKKCMEELELAGETIPELPEVRKSYFKLAAKFHPDKNPQGRERFEAVQKAYEILASEFSTTKKNKHTPKVINSNIVLLLRTQSLLFKRHSESLNQYKYAGYGPLLKLLAHEMADPNAFRKEVILIEPACELCYRTVDNAPLNADELLRENGFELLQGILLRCGELITPSTTVADIHVQVACHIVSCISVSARFQECRERMTKLEPLVKEVVRCMACVASPPLVKAAIQCCATMARSVDLQTIMYECGALWHLIRFIFGFDVTLEKSGVEVNERNHTQQMSNVLAKLSLYCVSRLCGYPPEDKDDLSQPHQGFHKALQQLLTPYLVRKLRNNHIDEVLELMNEANVETPYFIWSASCKAELLEYICQQSEKCRVGTYITAVEYINKKQAQELKIGDVFVRVYNLMPHYKIEDPPSFVQALVAALGEIVTAPLTDVELLLTNALMMVEASCHLINNNNALHTIVLNFFEILLQLLCKWGEKNVPSSNPRHEKFVLGLVTLFQLCCLNATCVEALATKDLGVITEISHLLFITAENSKIQEELLVWVNTLLTHKSFVQFTLDRGLYLILLSNFATSHIVRVREMSAACLLKCVTDKLNGPKIVLRISKIIPQIFLDTLRDNATTENYNLVFNLYESNQETPELIWNEALRKQAHENIDILMKNLQQSLEVTGGYDERKGLAPWKAPEEHVRSSLQDEINVCGVYLRLYLKQPNWNIRRPREFLMTLFERHVEIIAITDIHVLIQHKENLNLITTAILCNIRAQPSNADMIATFGHLGKVCQSISHPELEVASSCLSILHECSLSAPCVHSLMAQGSGCSDPLKPLMGVLGNSALFGEAVETMERMMTRSVCEKGCYIRLALTHDVVTKFLSFLEHDNSVANSAQARAIVVKTLKAMSNGNDIQHGGEVKERLNANPLWAKFSVQNHDLFLSQNTFAGYLTGPSSGPTLSITAGPGSFSAPPPTGAKH